jgi:protein arginine kinase
MLQELLASPLSPWQDGSGTETDIVMNSRIRLARNLKGRKFPTRAEEADLKESLAQAEASLPRLDALGHGSYEWARIDELNGLDRELLVEKQLISASHITEPLNRGVLLREDGAVSLLVNDEDYFRIQTASAGLSLKKAWEAAAAVDDALESSVNFAFSDEFGYFTANPAMVGTGLTAAVTLHLPALVMMKRISRIVQSITQLGYTVHALYDDSPECLGSVFQIVNQVSLGVTETSIIEQLDKIAVSLTQEERTCRSMLLSHQKNALKDRLCRTYGILSQAWLISRQEALAFVSDLRLAADMGIIHVRPQVFEAVLVSIQPGFLQKDAGDSLLTEEAQDILRAKVIRRILSAYII